MLQKAALAIMLLIVGCGAISASDEESDLVKFRSAEEKLAKLKSMTELLRFSEEVTKEWANKPDLRRYAYLQLYTINKMNAEADRVYEQMAENREVVDKQVQDVLGKMDQLPLEVCVDLLGYLREYDGSSAHKISDEAWGKRRTIEARYFFRVWKLVNGAVDPNFDLEKGKKIEAPQPPPEYFTDEGKRDPIVKAKYEAYEANMKKYNEAIERFNTQVEVRQVQAGYLPKLKEFVASAYSREPDGTKELKELLGQFVSDDSVKESLLSVANKKESK